MGLLDTLTNTLLDTHPGEQNRDELIAPLITIIERQEGLGGLYDMFLHHELDATITSWASGGEIPNTAQDIEKVFGQAFIEEYAGKLGIAPAEATDRLAGNMPRYIDELIEKGEWSKPDSLVDTAVEILKTKTFN